MSDTSDPNAIDPLIPSTDPLIPSTDGAGADAPLEPADTSAQSTVAVSGVSTTAEAGSVTTGYLQVDSAPAATDAAALAASAGTGTGVPPAPIVPPPTYPPAEEPSLTVTTPVRVDVIEQVKSELDAMERECLFWGGDVGVKLRNSVCRVRLLLVGQ